ncbi:hypothetical protein C8R46DRAFT_1030670 [Mycena filopes]|nr:hypothetical protein C8R46DRAFT_1030670 [Mycena filopes]
MLGPWIITCLILLGACSSAAGSNAHAISRNWSQASIAVSSGPRSMLAEIRRRWRGESEGVEKPGMRAEERQEQGRLEKGHNFDDIAIGVGKGGLERAFATRGVPSPRKVASSPPLPSLFRAVVESIRLGWCCRHRADWAPKESATRPIHRMVSRNMPTSPRFLFAGRIAWARSAPHLLAHCSFRARHDRDSDQADSPLSSLACLVEYPYTVSRSSPLHRDMEALKDDWNDFNDLDYSANKFGASNPRVRSNIRSVSCSSPLHRDMEVLKDDWNDFNDLGHSANKFGASNPRVRSNIRSVSCSSPLHRDMEALKDDWNDFIDLDYSANKFGASNPRVRSNTRSVSCSSPLHRDKEAFNDDWNEFNDLRYSANKFRPSTPHPTRLLGRISVRFPALYRDMDALNDDWNQFNDFDYFADTFKLGRVSVRFPVRRPLQYLHRVFVPVQPFYRDMDAFNDDWSDFTHPLLSPHRETPRETQHIFQSLFLKDHRNPRRCWRVADVVTRKVYSVASNKAVFFDTVRDIAGQAYTWCLQNHNHPSPPSPDRVADPDPEHLLTWVPPPFFEKTTRTRTRAKNAAPLTPAAPEQIAPAPAPAAPEPTAVATKRPAEEEVAPASSSKRAGAPRADGAASPSPRRARTDSRREEHAQGAGQEAAREEGAQGRGRQAPQDHHHPFDHRGARSSASGATAPALLSRGGGARSPRDKALYHQRADEGKVAADNLKTRRLEMEAREKRTCESFITRSEFEEASTPMVEPGIRRKVSQESRWIQNLSVSQYESGWRKVRELQRSIPLDRACSNPGSSHSIHGIASGPTHTLRPTFPTMVDIDLDALDAGELDGIATSFGSHPQYLDLPPLEGLERRFEDEIESILEDPSASEYFLQAEERRDNINVRPFAKSFQHFGAAAYDLGFGAIAAHDRTNKKSGFSRLHQQLLFPQDVAKQSIFTSHPAQSLLGGMSSSSATRLPATRVLLPNEILSLIFELLVGSPRNYSDIHELVVSRGNILQLSKRFQALCLLTPELWTAIDVNEHRLETVLSLEGLNQLLLRSKDRPLHVGFSVPISSAPGDHGLSLFQRVLIDTHRLQSICVRGASTCEYSFLCPHAIFARWPVLRDAPFLRVAWSNRGSTVRRCPIPHPAVPVRLPGLSVLKTMFPVAILAPANIPTAVPIVPAILPHLAHLGIDYQTSELWAKVLVSCVSLQTLRYGANNTLHGFFPAPLSIPSLRSLRIYRMATMPPVTAPNLDELSVVDPHTGITAEVFSSIVESATGDVALRSLDLLLNPVLNDDLNVILDRCPALRELRLCSNSRCELRTSTFDTLRYRLHTAYLRLGRVQFSKAIFSHTPPLNKQAASARRAFKDFCRIGFVRTGSDGVEISIHPKVFQVEVLGCRGYFPESIFSSGMNRFSDDNKFGDSLVAAQAYEVILGKEVPSVYTVILTFREPGAALNAMSRGVRQGGAIRKAYQFDRVWDEVAHTFV